ncbi:non-hydrolyzing UDP-N-acetylglucosamine 2-epimerase [Cellulosimicrobium cellulans]|uniref:UDP-N-acetylglucosamine 2-epimerase (non-hydrolyzing) n=1 Tax=Cellulosimicrobium cellulans TaxID=1710 RepID=A0A4Y4DX69_CELCE|nr:UDP-N-acetylglucosamine 2-epimerase (non-hydrolyzing) [Cellulosimicrobium cellulans]GED08020.1 UDP-N-acetyl glucosamine 2-epimerase [Cellulosimicrobium cellulans]
MTLHHPTHRTPEVAVVYGTRPEAIKMAPVVHALQAQGAVRPRVIVTGQHRHMLDPVNQLFGIAPEHDLDLFQPGASLDQIVAGALSGVGRIMREHDVRAVLVQGDTSTAFAGALAGYHAKVPVVHVEAGLRTGNLYSPFPEEGNRRLVSAITALHCAPTSVAAAQLHGEGIAPESVVTTGNTVIDALIEAAGRARPTGDAVVDAAMESGRPIVVATAHRRESWDGGIGAIGSALGQVARSRPDVLVVVPVHLNPRVRELLLPPLAGLDNVRILEPLSYGPFAHLLSRARVVVTDSGGIQEEAPALDVPVLVTRDTTERPEAIATGAAELVGTDPRRIVDSLDRLLRDEVHHQSMATAGSPFGDGKASIRVAAAVANLLGLGGRLPEFTGDVEAAVQMRAEPSVARADADVRTGA